MAPTQILQKLRLPFGGLLLLLTTFSTTDNSWADEDGVSFWLPGLFGSLAATKLQPGWGFGVVNYYTNVSARGSVPDADEVTIEHLNSTVNVNPNVKLNAWADIGIFDPHYAFSSRILGGQLALDLAGTIGTATTRLNGALTTTSGPLVIIREETLSDSRPGFGDLYPRATMRWNSGVNSWMAYATGDIPVGTYNSTNLANLSIGHGAADVGLGYTYKDSDGHEFSAVTGFTYNLTNSSTNYRNGIDWHLDWGASQFFSKQFAAGLVGYFYDQISADSGCDRELCPFESRVIGIGPQLTVLFPTGGLQGYLNIKGYGELDAQNRANGWNLWLTFSLSSAPPATSAPKPNVSPSS